MTKRKNIQVSYFCDLTFCGVTKLHNLAYKIQRGKIQPHNTQKTHTPQYIVINIDQIHQLDQKHYKH